MSNLDIHADEMSCSHCRSSDVVPYGLPPALGEVGPNRVFQCWSSERFAPEALTLTDGTYFCPTCRQYTTQFEDAGIRWD